MTSITRRWRSVTSPELSARMPGGRPGRERLCPYGIASASPADAEIFEHELAYALLHQIFSFNSPVWFNVGTPQPQQVSACFILSVDDSMESILDWYKEEGMIFKGGSGAEPEPLPDPLLQGAALLRRQRSGPVSFMRGADASAGTIKSGGATRRAAKMVVLDVDHPDIEDFIETKVKEEEKIRVLRDAGFDMDLGGDDITSVQYQNADDSVRVNDEFMKAVEQGGKFGLRARMTGEVIEEVDAKAPSARSPRRPGPAPTPASSTTTSSTTGTPAPSPAGSPRRTRAASTCTWTTRPATWPR
ncbi:hypothetical protein SGRIM128S_02395 [Streptomyces griseomycini]